MGFWSLGEWQINSGPGILVESNGNHTVVQATSSSGAIVLSVQAKQSENTCQSEAMIRIEAKLPVTGGTGNGQEGLPLYQLVNAAGESWRSRYSINKNIIEINSAHRDYIKAHEKVRFFRRYIGKLYAKEVVPISFPELTPGPSMERMVELLTRMEEKL